MPTISINLSDTTFVSSFQPDNNMNFYPIMYVGSDPSFQNCNGLLQFTLPSLPVTSVDSAIMQFTLIAKSQAESSIVTVNNATSSFSTTTVTYNTQPTFTPTTSQVSVNQSDLYQRVSIDITQLVNSWLAGTSENKGIVLTCPGDAVQFATNNIVYEPYFPTLTLTYSATPSTGTSAFCFVNAQLANTIKQLIALYPAETMTVYMTGGYYIAGTPYAFDETSNMIVELTASGEYASIPLINISAVTVTGTVYDPSITYLTPPELIHDCGEKYLDSIHNNFPLYTSVLFDLNTFVTASGIIYKNEYGMLVKGNDMEGSNPAFIPIWTISGIETTTPISFPTTDAVPDSTSPVQSKFIKITKPIVI